MNRVEIVGRIADGDVPADGRGAGVVFPWRALFEDLRAHGEWVQIRVTDDRALRVARSNMYGYGTRYHCAVSVRSRKTEDGHDVFLRVLPRESGS